MKKIFLTLFLILVINSRNKNSKKFYYDILEVQISATEDEILKSFRTLAKKYHPDKYGNSRKYTEIQRAYEILSDRTKKVIYDTDGIDEVLRYEHAENNGYVERRYNRLQAKEIKIKLTLKEAYLGGEKNINIRRQTICRHCQGTGCYLYPL